ncbi:TonB-dependent siderophore receptor [Oceanimonas sp. CHS3-5]|uniref:TonB-dependent receptor family protein n=1 Tax=Oceanimonas sp. CHS3-5 TaxID=3068186 RepID=UPI00273F8CC5|nr:TonB-dependent siderophore receptor [Oceanimonas sp. CHS3-5]MDP5293491.1 TonB-dependent siderophore receptor [Oceanimonas sp. CHS3-5]
MKSAGFCRRPLSMFVSLALMPALPLAAAEVASTQLDQIVVEGDWLGTSDKESVKTYTGARNVVDSEELHERGALNLEDALRKVPGIQVLDETGTGILPNIGVRGLNPLRSERVQLLVDGYPVAIGPYTNVGVSLFPVTLPSLEAVDIARGGAAVHYGPNNVGGVLNLITKPIPNAFEQTLRERLLIAEDTGHVLTDTYYRAGGFVTDNLGLQFQANLQKGNGFRDHSDTEVQNYIFDVDYFADDINEFKAQLQYYDVTAALPGALSPAAYEADRNQSQRPYDGYDADMWRGTLTWIHTPSEELEFQWRNFAHRADRTFFFGQHETIKIDPDTGNPKLSYDMDPANKATHVADSPRIFNVYGTEPRVTKQLGNHTLMLGGRYVREEVEFDVNRLQLSDGSYNDTVRDWDFTTNAYAAYVSDTISLLDDRLTLTPGIRYEEVRTDYRDDNSGDISDNHTTAWLPGLTLGLQATDEVFLFANAQRSLVPVQTAQVIREGAVANETAWNYELGARWQPYSSLETSATLFRIDYEDQIQYNKAQSVYENLGETRQQGIELEGRWQATGELALGLGYTFLDTELLSGDNSGNELPNAPRHRVSADAVYQTGLWTASATALYAGESFSDTANTQTEEPNGSAGKLPSYTLINTRLGRDIALGNDMTLNVGLGVNNLLDDDAYFRGADVSPVGRLPMPGRTYVLEGQLSF